MVAAGAAEAPRHRVGMDIATTGVRLVTIRPMEVDEAAAMMIDMVLLGIILRRPMATIRLEEDSEVRLLRLIIAADHHRPTEEDLLPFDAIAVLGGADDVMKGRQELVCWCETLAHKSRRRICPRPLEELESCEMFTFLEIIIVSWILPCCGSERV